MGLQLDIALDQSFEQHLHVRLIGKQLERSRLTFGHQHGDGERLLHQMQIASSELGHAVTFHKGRTTARGCLEKT